MPNKRKPLNQSRNPLLRRISTCLVKGYFAGMLFVVVACAMLYFLGFSGAATLLMLTIVPLMIRVAIAISCVLLITSFSEAI
jgi:hypothetical protein